MQFYNFIFLARSFAADKSYLVSRLAKVGKRAEANNTPLAFLIYPEGTVADGPGRAISKKYAEKAGMVRLFLRPEYVLMLTSALRRQT